MRTIGYVMLSASLLAASAGSAAELAVNTAEALKAALAEAQPGDVIVAQPGNYDLGDGGRTGRSGTGEKPITFRCAGDKGYATLVMHDWIGFRVTRRHWEFRGIHFAGTPNKTQAVLFLEGSADCGDLRFVDCRISGSKMYAVKSSRLTDKAVDNVVFEHCECFDTGHTCFDAPSGDNWVLRRNYIHDYGKGGGFTYGIYLKGGGRNGVIEGNIVDGKGGKATIGISFGGGLMEKRWLRTLPDGGYAPEHEGGVARNNIVVNTADVAFHSNNGSNCRFYNNLAWTKHSFKRQASFPKDPVLVNNLFGGQVEGAAVNEGGLAPRREWFSDPDKGDFRLTAAGIAALTGQGRAVPGEECPADFFGTRRDPASPVAGPVLPGANESTVWGDRRQ